MTLEKVLEAMPSEDFEPSWFYSSWAIFVVAVIWLCLVALALPYLREELDSDETGGKYVSLCLLAIIVPFLVIVVQSGMVMTEISNHAVVKSDWKQEYVGVYIEQLPEIKIDEVNKIELRDSNKQAKVFFSRDNEVEVQNVKVVLDLDLKEEPYVTYRELEKDIGWFGAGYYRQELHLPIDYQF